jgi:alpha-glucoside transport system permease protein
VGDVTFGPDAPGRLFGEVLVLDDVGPPHRGRVRVGAGAALLWLAPALVILGLLLGWPAVRTVRDSFVREDGGFAGAANYSGAFQDPQLWTDLMNTGIWAFVVPVLVTALGYVLAVLSRRAHAAWLAALVLLPIALPLLVTGVAFRLLYSPSPRLSPVTAIERTVAGWLGADPDAVPQLLGPGLVTVAIVAAFTWAWVGLAVVVFRAALDDIPPELEDAVRAEGADSLRVLRDVQWPFLRRVTATLVVLLAVVASRTFDLVLVMAPGSVQDRAEVLALYILRQPNVRAYGEAAAVGVIWLLVVAAGTILVARGTRDDWPAPHTMAPPYLEAQRRHWRQRRRLVAATRRPGRRAALARAAGRAAIVLVVVLWIFPVGLVVLVSLHDPLHPATRGWLAPLSLASYEQLGVLNSLAPTAILAVTVMLAVVAVASVTAYSLAWLRPPGARAATLLLVVAAIVPIQVVAKPLNQLLAPLGLQGTAAALALVHIARTLPFAVLVLRNAFAAVPADHIRRARLRGEREIGVLTRVVVPAARPALVTIATLSFVLVWNDLVVGLLFGGPGFTPVGLAVFSQTRQFVTSAGTLAAASVVASILPVLIVLVARRPIVSGLWAGVVRR